MGFIRRTCWGVGRFFRREVTGETRRLDDKPSNIVVTPKDAVIVETPGAGGYGVPHERDPERLADDVRGEKFSTDYMNTHYNQGKAKRQRT